MVNRSASFERVRLLAAISLLLAVCWLPPVPIDETRYLAVAWNMRVRHEWLVPWLDGAAYPDKPPLLFWLINGAWGLAGVHAWPARILEVALALLTLPLVRRLASELGADAPAADAAGWLWLGSLAFVAYAGAVMFDMLLCLCVLVAWLGSVWMAAGRWRAGTVLLSLGLGFGVLAKGPVCLLAGGLPALLGPWWSASARHMPWKHYLCLATALAGAIVCALAWAIPAAMQGGAEYASAIFLGQTTGRITESFAHDRSIVWYVPIVPVLLLPWIIGLGRGDRKPRERPSAHRLADRFALVATVPAFLVFSYISGKQPHYLLPLVPALAPSVGIRLAEGYWKLVGWRIGLLLLAIPILTRAALARLAFAVPPVVDAFLVLGILIGVSLFVWGRHARGPWVAALSVMAVMAIAKAALFTGAAPRFSIEPAARRVASAQQAGVPLLVLNRQNGMFTFVGRLRQPIPTAPTRHSAEEWVLAHPNGWVIGSDKGSDYMAPPLYRQPFLDHYLSIWRAADIRHEVLARSKASENPGAAGDSR